MPGIMRYAILVLVLLLVVVGLGWLSEQGTTAYRDDDSAYNRGYWEQAIRVNGAERAYASFKERNASAPAERWHFAAHVMGKALFSAEGVGGIGVCDESFGFGCFHGFFSEAVAEGGIPYIGKLDEECRERYGELGTGCQHGIGHGILEYVGYDQVSEALSLCKTETAQTTMLLGCTSGVFMEYLSPLTGAADSLAPQPRALDPQSPYAPCTAVAKEFQNSCYFELGQWLQATQPNAADLCSGLVGAARTHCFLGVGTEHGRVMQDAAEVAEVCGHFGSEDELSCRAGAAWWFFSAKLKDPASLCAYTSSAQRTKCLFLADLTEGKDTTFPL